MKCKECGCQFEESDSVGADFHECQDCWEEWSSRQFWIEMGGKKFSVKSWTIETYSGCKGDTQ